MADEIIQFQKPDDEEAVNERVRQRWLESGLGAARLADILMDLTELKYDPEHILLDYLEDHDLLPAFNDYLNNYVEEFKP